MMLVPPEPADTRAGDDDQQGQNRKMQPRALALQRWVLNDGRETTPPFGGLDRDTEVLGSVSGTQVLIGHQIG